MGQIRVDELDLKNHVVFGFDFTKGKKYHWEGVVVAWSSLIDLESRRKSRAHRPTQEWSLGIIHPVSRRGCSSREERILVIYTVQS